MKISYKKLWKLLDADFDSVEWDETQGLWNGGTYTAKDDDEYDVEVPDSMDSVATKVVSKAKTENIVSQQNKLSASERTSKVMVKQFRDYLAAKYGDQYDKLSDIFLGVDASYDADEMVALMRLVKVSPKALTGDANTEMVVFTPREYKNSRIADLYRWGAHLWGVRGLESRSGYLYIDSDGTIHDARGEADTVELLDNLNALYKEGLIATNLHQPSNYGTTVDKKTYCGFMMYDYSQSQGALNDEEKSKAVEGYCLRPILNAVADWKDDGEYFQFTESWRSVKTEGWCINAAIAKDEKKLLRALALFDYMYSEEGQALYTCGPKSEGYYTEIVDGVPQLSEKALEQFADANIGGYNYTNYFRKWVGAGLNIGGVKNYGVEGQCTSANAKAGVDIVAHALKVGTYKHSKLSFEEDEFYTICPSTFNLSSGNATTVQTLEAAGLNKINSNGTTNQFNIWDDYVFSGFGGKASDGTTLLTKEGYLSWINTDLNLTKLVQVYTDAYDLMRA